MPAKATISVSKDSIEKRHSKRSDHCVEHAILLSALIGVCLDAFSDNYKPASEPDHQQFSAKKSFIVPVPLSLNMLPVVVCHGLFV
jgi:hypothetical protein